MFLNKKCLKFGYRRGSGRNNQGRITVRHRGGGNKYKVFFVDFFRGTALGERFSVRGFISFYSKFAYLAIMKITKTGLYSLIINPKGLLLGDSVYNFSSCDRFIIGSSYLIGSLPVGSKVFCLESEPFFGSKLARAAGTYATLLSKGRFALVKLPSGQVVQLSPNCRVSLGEVNSLREKRPVYKAGQSRWFGQRPTVRGVAINPVDHPHGGGEGKSSIGRAPVSPWGSQVKGKKTSS